MDDVIRVYSLPKDLRVKVVEMIPQCLWRNKNIYSVLGLLESEVVRLKKYNDYNGYQTAQQIGNEILKWIQSDKDRAAQYGKMIDKYENKIDPYFGG